MEFLADKSPTITWYCQLLSQSLRLYYHYQWCNFMNHLFKSLNGILISPGFMIHLNICGNINNVKHYWNHVSYDIVASSFSWTKCGGTFWHTYGHIWWKPRMSVFWIFDILDEEGQVYLLGIVCFPSECFHYIPGSLPEGIYKVATQTNCFPCPNSPTIIRLPLAFMLCYDVFLRRWALKLC